MNLLEILVITISVLHSIIPALGSGNNLTHHYRRILLKNNSQSCLLIDKVTIPRRFKGFQTQDDNELQVIRRPSISALAEDKSKLPEEDADSEIVEVWGKTQAIVDAHIETLCKSVNFITPFSEHGQSQQGPEIVKIVDGGNQSNRIDVVFMGDGYTGAERDKFFADIRRLTEEMFQGVTFRSYLPVFNIWAIYVESVESGIGYDGAKNTPFRLYRAAGQLRGIYTENAQYARTICQLTGPGGCDYPSLIGNDDFYGGLGGEFVISTRSNRTGSVVLRHEMGHNFVNVGEEYDNGQVYRGVNSASSLSNVGWTHWLTNGPTPRAERAMYRILEYPWVNLWDTGIQVFNFTSDGTYSRWLLSVTVSAAGEADCLEFTLDGQVLPWTSNGFDDREFYDWVGDTGFTAGTVHSFTVRTKTPPTHPDIPRMICSVRLHEFGNEDEFHIDDSVVSAYPTWDVSLRVTYRPTNAGCLMRKMTHDRFCPVCQEGMWYQFLQRISIIDEISVSDVTNPDGTRRVTLHTLRLGQLRLPGNEVEGESLEVRWYFGGIEQPALRDMFEFDAAQGFWLVSIRFITPEVRSDPDGLLQEAESFTVL